MPHRRGENEFNTPKTPLANKSQTKLILSSPSPHVHPPPPPPFPPKKSISLTMNHSLYNRMVSLIPIFFICFISLTCLSQYYTRSWTFGLWRVLNYMYLTPEEFIQYDGSDFPNKPILISIHGHIFDVSKGEKFYKKGTGYNVFAGRDATRAFITGCFKTGLTHDLRNLTESQLNSTYTWLNFYKNHDEYVHVGYLKLPPIDPLSPLPNDNCTQAEIDLKEQIKREKIANGTWNEAEELLKEQEEEERHRKEIENSGGQVIMDNERFEKLDQELTETQLGWDDYSKMQDKNYDPDPEKLQSGLQLDEDEIGDDVAIVTNEKHSHSAEL